jgi:hypothetical protein
MSFFEPEIVLGLRIAQGRSDAQATKNDIDEETVMSRLMGWVLAVGLFAVVGQPARAQMPAPVGGGFGLQYTQPIPSGTLVLNRWGMLEATPGVGTALPPATAVEQPASVPPVARARVARGNRMGRSFARVTGRPITGAGVQPGAPLPSGSLYWPGAAGMPLYSPAQRYATYGYGYGASPYGTADYGAAYKGYYWAP